MGCDGCIPFTSMQEIIFNFGVIICYFATGTACAVYAKDWAEPPLGCPVDDGARECDFATLTIISALEAVSYFV